jgi:two-component system, OmpR family, response regulator PrrA
MFRYNLVYFDDQIQNIECFQVLLQNTFNIVGCVDSTKYEEVIRHQKPHALLIDLHMPVLDGLGLYSKITESTDYNGCPIFFISGDQSDESRIKTLKRGAIDFLERSLPEDELLARITNKIRYYLQGASVLELGNLRLDTTNYSTLINGKPVDLTLVETRLLCILMRSPNEPVSKTDVLEKVWGEGAKPGKIFTHLSNLGLKIWDWDYEVKVKGDAIFLSPAQ